jgi:Armadillo/beta-catenin-like repeat
VRLGGLEPLIRLMMSANVEVQCNAVGCITNLATHGPASCGGWLMVDENKNKIARSTALGPLTRLARSKDIRVQRNATGALLNMTHSGTPPPFPVFPFLCVRLRRGKTKIEHCWYKPVQSPSSSPFYSLPTQIFSTTARPQSPISPSTPRIGNVSRRQRGD